MTDPKELQMLIEKARAMGYTVDVTPRGIIVQAPGVGPGPMTDIFAAERLREITAQ